MGLEDLPTDILLEILELLTTKEKTRLSAVCRGLRDAIKASWTSIGLHFSSEEEVFHQTRWVNGISCCWPQRLQILQWQNLPMLAPRLAPGTSGSPSVHLYLSRISPTDLSLCCVHYCWGQAQAGCSPFFSRPLFAKSFSKRIVAFVSEA